MEENKSFEKSPRKKQEDEIEEPETYTGIG
jgi:hypothetical protein